MPCLPINIDNLVAASKVHDPKKPVLLLNLWRYRDIAQYAPEHAHLAGEQCTGEEAMFRYRKAIVAVAPPDTKVQMIGTPVAHVVAPSDEKWDLVALNYYPAGLEGFKSMVENETYKKEIEPHRLAGLEDFKLIMLNVEQ